MYKKLTVIVNRGMAEDVMDIARNLVLWWHHIARRGSVR